MTHDFNRFPELVGEGLDLYYWDSPHKQIFEDFTAKVMKVHDGDTITVTWDERDFPFPIRFNNLAAPELNETGGHKSQRWLEKQLLGKTVEVIVDPNNRVEKWGRLLGQVLVGGIDVAELSVIAGHGVPWSQRKEGVIDFNIGEFA